MLEHVLQYLYGPRHYNWPVTKTQRGKFTITGGGVELPFLLPGQHFRIVGSALNDGVYEYGGELDLRDEEFDGAVWALAIPRPVLELAREIEAWNQKNAEAQDGPYQSETYFGVYSYTKATDPATGGALTWQSVFRARLNAWRKI